MRKLLILSILAVSTAGASGCASRNQCGESSSWLSRCSLFGGGRSHTQQNQCCDPCGGGGNVSYGTVGYGATEMMMPTQSNCCN